MDFKYIGFENAILGYTVSTMYGIPTFWWCKPASSCELTVLVFLYKIL